MWWSDRRAFLIGAIVLSGCGFSPVYAPGGGDQTRGQIAVAAPADEEGFALVERLEDRLGRASDSAPYTLTAEIFLVEDAVGFLPDGTISRYNISGRVDWIVADTAGATRIVGSEESFTSYSATSTTVATTVARRDARRRLMVLLADRIVADILIGDLE